MDYSVEFAPGSLVELASGVRRLVAPNPGPMTGPGTNTYIVGHKAFTIIDPGPDIESHVDALSQLGVIERILVTHTHRDHSPAAATLARHSGAPLVGRTAPGDDRQDMSFHPDHVPVDDELLELDGFTLQAIATPGHASNHLCYFLPELGWLFTGDHIMGGSTVVIAPPDGDMDAYLNSLEGLKRLRLNALLPGHGGIIEQPRNAIDGLIRHRLAREAKVIAALSLTGPQAAEVLLPVVYDDVPEALHPVAKYSLLAHLQRLANHNRASEEDVGWRRH
jgi:glyoxylase-like metal-dependent hydrolase (beta-lactamase superfamily II)